VLGDLEGGAVFRGVDAGLEAVADDRKSLWQLCRNITRPALANERVQCDAAGQVVPKLKTPWHDSTANLVFMERLAALAPLSRLQVHALFTKHSRASRCLASTNSGQ